jgi:hypothetical protein
MYVRFGGKARRKENTRKILNTGGSTILKWILEK